MTRRSSQETLISKHIADELTQILEDDDDVDIASMSDEQINEALYEQGYTPDDLIAISHRFQQTLDKYSQDGVSTPAIPDEAASWPVVLIQTIAVESLNTLFPTQPTLKCGTRSLERGYSNKTVSLQQIRLDKHPDGEKWLLKLSLSQRSMSNADVDCLVDGQPIKCSAISVGDDYLVTLETADEILSRTVELRSDQQARRIYLRFE